MIDDFILGLAVAIFGGVLALMGLPSRFRTRLPIAFAGLAMVWAALAGVRIVLSWGPY
jgi:small basic protein